MAILVIFRAGTKEQVRRIHTWRIVATVKDPVISRTAAVMNLITSTMSLYHARTSRASTEASVTFDCFRTHPEPTCIRPAAFIDSLPEACNHSFVHGTRSPVVRAPAVDAVRGSIAER